MLGGQFSQVASILKDLFGVYSTTSYRMLNTYDNLTINRPPVDLRNCLQPIIKIIRYILYCHRCHIKHLQRFQFDTIMKSPGFIVKPKILLSASQRKASRFR